MRRLLILLALLFMSQILSGQNGEAIDELFRKYSGREGITSVYISGKMFGMFSGQESNNEELNKLFSGLKSLRILTVEDSSLNEKINFYEELKKKIDFNAYEELMVVNEADNVTKFLIRESGKKIAELIILSGGNKGNTLISIRGDIDLRTISGLSKKMGLQQLEQLDELDRKPSKK